MLRTGQDLDNQLSVIETESEMAQAKAQAQINQAKATQELKKSYDEITKSYKSQLQEFCTSITATIKLENFNEKINDAYVCFDPANISNNILKTVEGQKSCENPSHILLDCFGSAIGLNKNDVIDSAMKGLDSADFTTEITLSTTGGTLAAGMYMITLNGGGGGGGRHNEGGNSGKGGNGEQIISYFYLPTSSKYSLFLAEGGQGGAGGSGAGKNGSSGGDAGVSTFEIEGIISVSAAGGKGGQGATKSKMQDGENAGNGEGAAGGDGGSGKTCYGGSCRRGDDGAKASAELKKYKNDIESN